MLAHKARSLELAKNFFRAPADAVVVDVHGLVHYQSNLTVMKGGKPWRAIPRPPATVHGPLEARVWFPSGSIRRPTGEVRGLARPYRLAGRLTAKSRNASAPFPSVKDLTLIRQ